MRGIVISPVKINGKNNMSISQIDPIKLRQYLLYWDKIDLPQSNIISFRNTPEIDYLQNVGLLKQTRLQISLSGAMTEVFLKGQISAFKMNNEVEKGCWTLGQENIDLVLPKNESVLDRGIELNLYNSLPIPSPEVSLEEIIHFKEKRKDELMEFRFLMDHFYQDLIKSVDSERAMETYLQKIERNINAIDRTMKESVKKRLLGNLKVRFDVGEMIKNSILGAASAPTLTIPVAAGAILGAASSIRLNTEMLIKPKGIPTELKDYAYLFYVNEDLM
ncbi:DUF6236 family protein [Fictibacillus enclensis]|uniref:DUF6236 family protein n=1 Tax=Fictibacillus enclensis TaxID=1017270 RepID=UPI0025A0527C|nr:DUF6236 family protein [Fictibacillus enclensis]MDM5197872.1 DUF6236 family protein [Fictibacillus enclensis]